MEEPITFAEMYKRKMSKDLELARLKKLAKQQDDQAQMKSNGIDQQMKPKVIDEILA